MYVCSEGFGVSLYECVFDLVFFMHVTLNSGSERERERERERESISRLPPVVFLWIKGRGTGL